jgi:hypothetical protein
VTIRLRVSTSNCTMSIPKATIKIPSDPSTLNISYQKPKTKNPSFPTETSYIDTTAKITSKDGKEQTVIVNGFQYENDVYCKFGIKESTEFKGKVNVQVRLDIPPEVDETDPLFERYQKQRDLVNLCNVYNDKHLEYLREKTPSLKQVDDDFIFENSFKNGMIRYSKKDTDKNYPKMTLIVGCEYENNDYSAKKIVGYVPKFYYHDKRKEVEEEIRLELESIKTDVVAEFETDASWAEMKDELKEIKIQQEMLKRFPKKDRLKRIEQTEVPFEDFLGDDVIIIKSLIFKVRECYTGNGSGIRTFLESATIAKPESNVPNFITDDDDAMF